MHRLPLEDHTGSSDSGSLGTGRLGYKGGREACHHLPFELRTMWMSDLFTKWNFFLKAESNDTKVKTNFNLSEKVASKYNLIYRILFISVYPFSIHPHVHLWRIMCSPMVSKCNWWSFWGKRLRFLFPRTSFELFCVIWSFSLSMCHFYGNHEVTLF